MRTVELIRHIRDRQSVNPAAITAFVDGVTQGSVPDYQTSALLMAVFHQGLADDATVALTLAMRDSGVVVEHPEVTAPRIDKHSTGGVGDKISIALAPMVAACGVAVPMVSGRGLGHTGGTLDKLEAIPGFNVEVTISEFQRLVAEHGFALIGQTDDLAPADRTLYALRDVTATVESIPLITASILSKKLAEGIEGLVLDVKVGRGAFMKNLDDARALATALVRIGTGAGLRVQALLTRMEEPLGLTIGNALETREAIDILNGHGPADTTALTMRLGCAMLELAGIATGTAAQLLLDRAINSGAALAKLRDIVAAQGGDPRTIDDPSLLPSAPHRRPVPAPSAASPISVVQTIDSQRLGLAAMTLGAGRATAADRIDPAVGIELAKRVGDHVDPGEPLAVLHHADTLNEDQLAAVENEVAAAFLLGETPSSSGPLVLETIS